MGNSSSFSSLDDLNITKKLSLKDFKAQIKRSLTIHMLSNQKEECKNFVEILTGEKFRNDSDELLEKDISKKINLYSFMNYKIGTDPTDIIDKIIEKANKISSCPSSNKYNFSELIILIDDEFNDDYINNNINIIRNKFFLDNKNKIFFKKKPYLIPFIIILSSRDLILKDFIQSKTFHFKINLKDIMDIIYSQNNLLNSIINEQENQKNIDNNIENTNIYSNDINISNIDEKISLIDKNINNEKEKENKNQIQFSLFFRKINVIFSYYNELGDEFSFINSDNLEKSINNETETDSPIFINILLIGKTGSGKTTLINLILEEKKSLEGGIGISTTSKNILVYKKSNLALRFYDVKGLEDEKTLKNYVKILKDFNSNNNHSSDIINAIFYCKQYGDETIIEEPERKIIDELIEFNIPILFLFTHTPYDLRKEEDHDTEEFRKLEREEKINVITSEIKNCFIKKNRKIEYGDYINQFINFYFVNLVEDYSLKVPIFGINDVLSYFKNSVSDNDWKALKENCEKKNCENCKELCKRNPFLKKFEKIDIINEINKYVALEYLESLKFKSYFISIIPIIDLISEVSFKNLFKKKLKVLYGFDYETAEKKVNSNYKNNMNKNIIEEYAKIKVKENNNFIKNESDSPLIEINKNIDDKIKKCSQIKTKIVKLFKRSADVIIPVTGFVLKQGVKTIGFGFLPITTVISIFWNKYNIESDCKKYLEIYEEAFSKLKFEVLEHYINAFIDVINNLDNIGKNLVTN